MSFYYAEYSLFSSIPTDRNTNDAQKKERKDRKYTSFYFCSDDHCIESFQSEDDLLAHETIGEHTTIDSVSNANDTAKVLLFDKYALC